MIKRSLVTALVVLALFGCKREENVNTDTAAVDTGVTTATTATTTTAPTATAQSQTTSTTKTETTSTRK